MQEFCVLDGGGDDTGRVFESPAVLAHMPVNDREADHGLQPLQLAEDQGAMRPGTGERDIEMVASRLGGKAAGAGWSRRAVERDPVADRRRGPHEPAVLVGRKRLFLAPSAVQKET